MRFNTTITLMLLISFGSVCAVICTPVLPLIQEYFKISQNTTGNCISYYLVGYALGQLIYGPLINYFGSRKTTIIGITTGIVGGIVCILSSLLHQFDLMLFGRVIMALGAGSGLTLAFAICSKLSSSENIGRSIGILSIAFAIMPGIGIFIGGLLSQISWVSPFYFAIVYGVITLLLAIQLPEIITELNHQAIRPSRILTNYLTQLKNINTVLGGLMVGGATTIIYAFAALAPFMTQGTIMQLTPQQYGKYNFIPVIGMIIGSIIANQMGRYISKTSILKIGLILSFICSLILAMSMYFAPSNPLSLFIPTGLVYIGLTLIFSNGSAIALSKNQDKSNASAVLNFVNMGCAVIVIEILESSTTHNNLTLPLLFIIISLMIGAFFATLNYVTKIRH